MSERYQQLQVETESLYSVGAPVIIQASALLKDTRTNSLIGQCKYISISNKTIIAVKVRITSKDIAGRTFGNSFEYQYLDLDIHRNQEFGSQTAIHGFDNQTRSFSITVTEVVFDDHSIWENETNEWTHLESPINLIDHFGGKEYAKQYRMEIGDDSRYYPTIIKDLWYCTCGCINHCIEQECFSCQRDFSSLQDVTKDVIEKKAEQRLKSWYQEAVSKMNDAEDVESLLEAKAFLKEAEYLDSNDLIKKCQDRIDVLQSESREAEAVERSLKQKKRKRQIILICCVLIIICFGLGLYSVVSKVLIPNQHYNAALSLKNEKKWEEAILAFEELQDYKDSVSQIIDTRYLAAVELMEIGQYKEAMVAFSGLEGYSDSEQLIHDCYVAITEEEYVSAITEIENGEIIPGYERLLSLDGYKDSAEKAAAIYAQYNAEKIKAAQVGDIIIFGAYEQDNNTKNGTEEIEWIVLERKDDQLMVISLYGLDQIIYSGYHREGTTWENCYLRKWLNETFIESAFTPKECARILETNVSADENPVCSTTDPGNSTIDRVFLLSAVEVEQYFPTENVRKCCGTRYCFTQGVYEFSDGSCMWWTRTPGDIQTRVAYVSIAGKFDNHNKEGVSINDTEPAVRPVMWITIE